MKLLLPLIALSLSPIIHAKCNTGAIIMKRESGFGISLSGGGISSSSSNEESINVPFSLNNEPACFVKKSKFEVKTESSKDAASEKITISPLKVEFENVPDAKVRQYIFAEKGKDKLSTKFYSMSFVCAGELPLSIEGYADSYLDLKIKSTTVEMNTSMTFATGAAADNLKRNKVNTNSNEAFKFFTQKFQMNTKDFNCCEAKLPSIFSESSVSAISGIERTVVNSFYTIGNEIPNGCSQNYAEKMQNYLVENYEKNDSLNSFKVSKKWFKDDIVLEWK